MSTLKPVTAEEWSNALDTARLTPGPTFGYGLATSGWEAAVHIATSDDLTDATRAELIAALQDSIDATVRRVLGHSGEIRRHENYADGTSQVITLTA
ncbi:hypothetical protein [Streptomyces sp. bgisy022]|uniref:hypothetical protein n=1 Tax=Streptomyces sp. bgisy022 TaxID=3413769 RepID=UPI003D728A48